MGPALDKFQLDTLAFLDNAGGRAVVADPMGARKTGTVLAWCERADVERVLIIAPASVHGHWAREAARFAPKFEHVERGRGDKDHRAQALEIAALCSPSIYITTYESAKLDQRVIEKAGFDCVVFDEGHKLKGRRTQVALMANALAKTQHCIIVTGTPVLNHAAELWQYLHMLRPKDYRAFWTWVLENFRVEERRFRGNRFPTRIIHDWKPGRLVRVQEQVGTYFIQRDIKDLFPNAAWIDEAEHVSVNVELSPGERKAYDQLVKHHWTEIEGREIVTGGALDLTTRLGQLISSWTALGAEKAGSKVLAAAELIQNLVERDERVLVLVKYKETMEVLMSALLAKKLSTVVYYGDLSQDVRDRNLAAFCSTAESHPDVMIGTLDSLSEGVDGMQHVASNIVMLDRHWVPAKNDQAIGRLRRSGQLKRVTVYHVFAEGTIDETITAACLRKQNVVELLRDQSLTLALYGHGRG